MTSRLPGNVATVSKRRLRVTAACGDKRLFFEGLIIEAMQELGHTLGLGHCEDPLCATHNSNSLLDADRKVQDYCESCLRKLEEGV